MEILFFTNLWIKWQEVLSYHARTETAEQQQKSFAEDL
jgi:hypothetical protein